MNPTSPRPARDTARAVTVLVALTTAGGLVGALILFATVIAPTGDDPGAGLALTSQHCDVPGGVDVPGLTGEQATNAATIIGVAADLHLGPRGMVIGVATAMQEATLRNLDHGDRDSLGLFQQRAAWGTAAERTDPTAAARMFYLGGHGGQRGLTDVPRWRQMPLWQAAQAVQVSAFPMAYQRWTDLATATVARITGTTATGVCGPTPAGAWTTPVAKGRYVLTSGYGPRDDCAGICSAYHRGLDFAAPTGTPARAASAGTVTATTPEAASGGFGNLVIIDHGAGTTTYYGHLSAFAVRPGTRVTAGQRIGDVGSTGNSTGPHLHLEVRRHGQPTDPATWLTDHHATP